MLEYIYSNLEYPSEAMENEVEGTAVIQFKIWKNGTVRDVKIVRNPGTGTGEEAARIVSSMMEMEDKWRPGHQKGKPVNVQYTLPIKFKIEGLSKQKVRRNKQYRNSDSYVHSISSLYEKPLFPDCTENDDSKCTTTSLLEFVEENQLYPEIALENRTEGIVHISFIIEIDGSLSNIKAKRQHPDGLSEDAVEIFEWMNKEEMRWTPGTKEYRKVRTLFEWDVVYDLSDWEGRN